MPKNQKSKKESKTINLIEHENQFMLTSDPSRLGKIMAHYELYRLIKDLPGVILECGVFKGNSFIQFATFAQLSEASHARKLIGFDTFGEVPPTDFAKDKKYLENFKKAAGDRAFSIEQLTDVLNKKRITNYELVKGDVVKTVPTYLENNPHIKIALLHIDTDIYEPAKVILETLYDKVVRGGVIAFDDYGTFPGETQAADEFFADKKIRIVKFPFSHIPSYVIKS